MKRNKIIYWIATGLLSALMLMSVSMYLFDTETIAKTFTALGFPTYLVYFLAIAKLLGIIAILSKLSQKLKEWAYAGFGFNFILAAMAHIQVGDNEYAPALVALLLLIVSYIYDKKLFKKA
jgi:hypothetical protein